MNAPLYFTICVDAHRFERIMAQRGWEMATNDLSLLLLGIQDAALMAENMVIAAESLGLGSCFLGGVPYQAAQIIREYNLPPRVFPLVGLAMGYPAAIRPPGRATRWSSACSKTVIRSSTRRQSSAPCRTWMTVTWPRITIAKPTT